MPEAKNYPDCPEWWPRHWPWPPKFMDEAWSAKVNRDFEQFSDRLHRRETAWDAKQDRDFEEYSDKGHRRAHQTDTHRDDLFDERFDTQANYTYRNQRDEGKYDHREAKAEEDTRTRRDAYYDRQVARENDRATAKDELLNSRLQFTDALWSSYLNRHDASHAMTMEIISDMLSDARLSRSVAYDRAAEKAMNTQLVETIKNAVSTALKEALGPPRGGVTPGTGPETG